MFPAAIPWAGSDPAPWGRSAGIHQNKESRSDEKRILSVILTLTLCAGLSVPAFAARAFTDVPADYWAYDAIQYVTDEGLFSGTSAPRSPPAAP